MPKRRERVAPPPKPGGWDLRYATGDAVTGWEKVRAAAPGNARTAWEKLSTEPRERSDRQHPLKGALGIRLVNGETLEQVAVRGHRRRAALVLHRRSTAHRLAHARGLRTPETDRVTHERKRMP